MSKAWKDCEEQALRTFHKLVREHGKPPTTVETFCAGFRYCWLYATSGPEKASESLAAFNPFAPLLAPQPDDSSGPSGAEPSKATDGPPEAA
jgi:hypothetical protein